MSEKSDSDYSSHDGTEPGADVAYLHFQSAVPLFPF